MVDWEIKAVELVSCNCAYGCPCQFNALPTHGNCHTVGGYEIRKGHFGEVSLDGTRMATIATWPGAIHEGGGAAQAVVDASASEEQRNAILTIMAGRETDPGATIWNVLSATFDTFNSPLFLPIDMGVDVEARRGHVRVEGVLDISAQPIRNPVTGEEHGHASICRTDLNTRSRKWAAAPSRQAARSKSPRRTATRNLPISISATMAW